MSRLHENTKPIVRSGEIWHFRSRISNVYQGIYLFLINSSGFPNNLELPWLHIFCSSSYATKTLDGHLRLLKACGSHFYGTRAHPQTYTSMHGQMHNWSNARLDDKILGHVIKNHLIIRLQDELLLVFHFYTSNSLILQKFISGWPTKSS